MRKNKIAISPYLTLAFGIFGLSMTSIFVRWADAPGTVTAAYRMAFSAIVLTPFVVRQEINIEGRKSSLLRMIPLAGLFVALDHGFLNTAIGMTKIANCTLLNNIRPNLGGAFRPHRLARKNAQVVLGWIVFHACWRRDHLGQRLDTSSTIGPWGWIRLSFQSILCRIFFGNPIKPYKISALQYIWMVNIVSAVLLFAYNMLMGNPLFGYSPLTWLVFIGAGVFSQTVGYFSVAHALGHLPASIVSPTMVLQIVLTALLAIPFAGESLSSNQLIGGLTILAGILIINLTRRQKTVNGRQKPLTQNL
jgi:drug/metabolite transporter (DMT)-like permease